MDTKKLVKLAVLAIGMSAAVYIAVATPFEGLSQQGSIGFAVFLGAVTLWITDFIPDFATALLMCTAWALLKAVPFSTAFSAFTSTTVWLLIGAFVLATAIGKCGLLNRFALFLMTKFPLTFKGQTFGLAITSLLMSPLVPSIASRCAILGPLSVTISDNMGYERQSKGAVGIFASTYISNCVLFAAFLTGSFMCYMVLGLLPKETQAEISWLSWLLYSSVWLVVVFVVSFIFIQIYHKPENTQAIGGDELKKRRQALGGMSKDEKLVTAVLIFCLCFWITEKQHGISSAIITMIAAVILISRGIVDRQSFRASMPWDVIMFIGGVLCCGAVFKATGIDAFFGNTLGPIVIPIMEKSFVLFLILFSLLMYAVRFIITSQTAAITIFVIVLIPVAQKMGINPWVIGFVVYTSTLLWLTKYQNVNFIVMHSMVTGTNGQKDLVRHPQTIPLSIVFMISSIIGYIASVPLWKFAGLM